MAVTTEIPMERDEYDYYTGQLRAKGIKPINRLFMKCLMDTANALGIPPYVESDRTDERSSQKISRKKAGQS
jgi:hypothetical protein